MNQEEYSELSSERNLSQQNLIVMYQLIVNGTFTKAGFDEYLETLDNYNVLAHRCDEALKTLLKDANPHIQID